jgi:hypothetical protein
LETCCYVKSLIRGLHSCFFCVLWFVILATCGYSPWCGRCNSSGYVRIKGHLFSCPESLIRCPRNKEKNSHYFENSMFLRHDIVIGCQAYEREEYILHRWGKGRSATSTGQEPRINHKQKNNPGNRQWRLTKRAAISNLWYRTKQGGGKNATWKPTI